MRGWMDGADIVSEGGMNGDRYFGSTSIFLAWQKAPEGLSYDNAATRAQRQALLHDPHLRVRALRLARREAEARATGNISSVSADLRADFDARGMFVTIDVEARIAAKPESIMARRGALHS